MAQQFIGFILCKMKVSLKTYRNEKHGFEINIPEEWLLHAGDESVHPLGKGHMLIFKCRPNEAFNFQIAPLTPEPALDQTELEFRRFAQEKGYTSLALDRLAVGGKEHVWARYYMGGGLWSKKYMIVLNGIEYVITATCMDQRLLLEMEKVWDAVIASFRLMKPADKTANPMDKVSEQKKEITDKNVAEVRNAEPQVLSRSNIGGVKTYRNEKHGFEIDMPEEWAPAPALAVKLTQIKFEPQAEWADKDVFQYGWYDEAFNFEIGPLFPEPLLDDTEIEFRLYARDKGFKDLHFGRITVASSEHVCAHYFINDKMGKRWNKKYMIVFGGIEYTITGTCNDPQYFTKREQDWDVIIQSFRLFGTVEQHVQDLKTHRVDAGGELYERAYEAVSNGDDPKALLLLESCLSENPDHVLAHKEIAIVLKKMGNLQGALSHRREVKRLDPSDMINRYNLADLLAGLGEREAAWQEIKELQAMDPNNPEFQKLVNLQNKSETPENGEVSPKIVSDIYEAGKEISGTGKDQEKQRTLAFSIISYILIAAFAFLYIHSKVAVGVLLNLDGESSQSLFGWGYNIVILTLYYGIGASICLLFLLGVLINRQVLNRALTNFNLIEWTMQVRDGQNETFGGIIFSDYTRRPTGVLDTLSLQLQNFIRALIKITFTFLSMGFLGPVMTFIVAAVVFVPQLILDYPVPILWQVGISSFWFYSCYRALLFWLAKRRGISKSDAKPDEKLNPSILLKQQEPNEKIRQGNPKTQAALYMFKAISFYESKQGSRAGNLEKAIYFFQQALEALSRHDNPDEWASTQNNLGEAYRNLSLLRDRAKNLDQAIFHYHQALEVVTRQADPDLWAAAHNNLGIAYANGASGNQAENVEQAIWHCQQALEVYTRKAFPDDWAMTQNNLGSAYNKRLRGERANNIEQAISCFQQALEVQTHQADREQWAGTQTNLAQVYWVRLGGERAENLEQVITHDQQALEVYKRESYPQDWANTHNRLGAAYQIRMRGDHAENLEQAIQHIELALTIYSRQSIPKHWAEAQTILGLAFQGRKRGERAENIEKAISLFLQALQVYTRRDFPVDWAVTQNYLAFAYEDRIRGNRADNIERAIGYFQQALEVFTRQTHPEHWAHTHTPLASAYEMRKMGKRHENLDQAIWHYQQALEVHTRQAYPDQWAMGQIFLGITCIERKRGKLAEYTAQAIQYFQQAQQVFTRDKYPEEWAKTQEGLAAAYNEAGLVSNPPMLSYPQFYHEESQQQPGQKRTLKLVGSIIPDFPYFIHLLLLYQWDENLPDDEANRLAKRAIAYISCAIYDAARSAGWPCQASPIPNGRRPAWILDGERSPVSLTLSDIDLSERNCQLTIGAVITEMGKPPSDRARWEKLQAAFNSRFSNIIV